MGVFILPAGVPEKIECSDQFGARRPCQRCGSVVFRCEPGKGPHALGLRCDGCGKDYRWLGAPQVEEIKTARGFFEHHAAIHDSDPASATSEDMPW